MTQPARRRFPGRHDQVSCARAFVRDILGGCPQLDEAVLLTSELCTNALQHTHSGDGGTFEVTVYHRPGSLRIEVRDDGSPSGPVPQPVDSCSLDGRGLEIVACLAHRWGQRGDEYGRCVYFELRWPDPAGPDDPAPSEPAGARSARKEIPMTGNPSTAAASGPAGLRSAFRAIPHQAGEEARTR